MGLLGLTSLYCLVGLSLDPAIERNYRAAGRGYGAVHVLVSMALWLPLVLIGLILSAHRRR